jgi:hypothetical protein
LLALLVYLVRLDWKPKPRPTPPATVGEQAH